MRLTQTYYKAFAPRIGISWSPGSSGKTSIKAGWGLFYNPIEQLVLEQFSAEPPFGGSTFPLTLSSMSPFSIRAENSLIPTRLACLNCPVTTVSWIHRAGSLSTGPCSVPFCCSVSFSRI